MAITPVLDLDDRIGHFIAIKNDITERVLLLERLKSSLKEKEVLLKEIHHRVKNNMQLVSSLLSISSLAANQDSQTQSLITELHRRIETMSIVHQQFYAAADVSRIDFALSLRHITNNLFDEYEISPGTITVKMQTETLLLDLDSAIPVGLIVSELISNALKAMKGSVNQARILCIFIQHAQPGRVEIGVQDTGPGLAPDFNPKSATTMGMSLIGILADQLHGSVEFESSGGTSAILSFPLVQL